MKYFIRAVGFNDYLKHYRFTPKFEIVYVNCCREATKYKSKRTAQTVANFLNKKQNHVTLEVVEVQKCTLL